MHAVTRSHPISNVLSETTTLHLLFWDFSISVTCLSSIIGMLYCFPFYYENNVFPLNKWKELELTTHVAIS